MVLGCIVRLPAGQVQAGEQVLEILRLVGGLFWCWIAGRQLLDLKVAEMALRPLRFERQVAFTWLALTEAGHLFAVDVQL